MSKRKKGETAELILLAISELEQQGKRAKASDIIHTTGLNHTQVYNHLSSMGREGKITRLGEGFYKLTDPNARPTSNTEQPIAHLTSQLNSIPDTIASVIESIVELLIEPEAEILALLDRRTKRINDLEVLLNSARLESSNARAKIEELTSRINRLAAQKNRVIPETKVVYR